MAGALATMIQRVGLLALQLPPADPEPALPPAAGGYGVQLVRSALALLGVCVAAWLVLRWAAQRGLGQGPRGRNVRVLERVALDPRRSLYLVEVGARVLLLGSAEGGLSLLAELKPEELSTQAHGGGTDRAADSGTRGRGSLTRFADVIARVRQSGVSGRPDAERAEPDGTTGPAEPPQT